MEHQQRPAAPRSFDKLRSLGLAFSVWAIMLGGVYASAYVGTSDNEAAKSGLVVKTQAELAQMAAKNSTNQMVDVTPTRSLPPKEEPKAVATAPKAVPLPAPAQTQAPVATASVELNIPIPADKPRDVPKEERTEIRKVVSSKLVTRTAATDFKTCLPECESRDPALDAAEATAPLPYAEPAPVSEGPVGIDIIGRMIDGARTVVGATAALIPLPHDQEIAATWDND